MARSRVNRDFGDFCPHTVKRYTVASRDSYGKPTYSTSYDTYNARVKYAPSNVRAPDGSIVVARGVIWVMENASIAVDDKIVLPDDSSPPIINIDRNVPDELGGYYTKVYFG